MHDDGRTTLAAARRWARLDALDVMSYSHAAQLGQGGEA